MLRYGFFAAGVLAAGLLAVTTAQAAQLPRIGVVNLQEVIANSQAGQQANKELQGIVKNCRLRPRQKQQIDGAEAAVG